MLRVAWRLPDASAWTGGQNYFFNLAKALFLLPERDVEIVLLGTNGASGVLKGCEVIPDHPCRRYSQSWFCHTFNRLLLSRDPALEKELNRYSIDILSHSVPLGRVSSIPALCWIPDLQHKRMPQFFSARERAFRDLAFWNIARGAQGVLFSSEDARKDFLRFYPKAKARTFVLPFVADVKGIGAVGDWNKLKSKYGLDEPYFIVPNQVWKHKNHEILIEALKLAGKDAPLILCTGATQDYRHPGYFDFLQHKLIESNLSERLRFLGRIPFEDLGALMRHSLALINPSYFEGWSTSVEEAKSLGKRVILSDIPVHREQNPLMGIYFPPDCPEALWSALKIVMGQASSADTDERSMREAALVLPERMRQYGRAYEAIIHSIITKN